uniref:Uncharacterized protein n=1 Tax=Arundo donax TaxID=35708 RepID=A0A0A9BRJ5_ARUDO
MIFFSSSAGFTCGGTVAAAPLLKKHTSVAMCQRRTLVGKSTSLRLSRRIPVAPAGTSSLPIHLLSASSPREPVKSVSVNIASESSSFSMTNSLRLSETGTGFVAAVTRLAMHRGTSHLLGACRADRPIMLYCASFADQCRRGLHLLSKAAQCPQVRTNTNLMMGGCWMQEQSTGWLQRSWRVNMDKMKDDTSRVTAPASST